MVAFIAYLMLMVVTVGSMVFGAEWLMQPVDHQAPAQHSAIVAKVSAKSAAKSPAPRVTHDIGPRTKAVAKAEPADTNGISDAGSHSAAPRSVSASMADSRANIAAADIEASKPTASACNISACSSAYNSFRASDCTYQPYVGPRKLCRKGVTAAATPVSTAARLALSDAREGVNARAQSCNVQACSRAYQSFDPATCTYQPYDGARRLCAK